jgi:hypothetical protein
MKTLTIGGRKYRDYRVTDNPLLRLSGVGILKILTHKNEPLCIDRKGRGALYKAANRAKLQIWSHQVQENGFLVCLRTGERESPLHQVYHHKLRMEPQIDKIEHVPTPPALNPLVSQLGSVLGKCRIKT